MTTSAIDGSAFGKAARELRGFDAAADRILEDTVDAEGAAVQVAVRARARRHTATGRMVRQVELEASGSGSTRRATVHAFGRVAHLITGGTAPHLIRPLRDDAIRMPGVGRGFAAAVRHPGTRPDPFFDQGVDDADAELDQINARAADRLADALAGG